VDTELDNGPLSESRRSCTDIIFYGIFIAFCVGMFVIAIYAFIRGNPGKFLSGVDDDGNFCGYSNGYGDHKRLYFPDLSSTSAIRSKYFWVAGDCPKDNAAVLIDCKPTAEAADCNAGTRYVSVSYLGRYCLPDRDKLPQNLKDNYDALWDYLDLSGVERYINDIATGWPILLIGFFITLVFCMIFMLLVEYWAAILAWISIGISFAALTGLGFYFFFTRNANEGQADDNTPTLNIVWACFCWAGALAIFLFVCCYWKALRIAIGVLQAAADFITDTKRILIVPVIGFIIVGIFYTIWIVVAIFVYTIGEIKSTGGQGKQVEWEDATRRVWYYHFFGLFWINAFLDACVSFVIIVASSTWYFSHATDREGSAEVYKGFRWIWRYHCGSLAFGSLILAIVQLIRTIFEYVRKRIETTNPTNVPLRIFLWMVSYCIACLNRFIKFINQNAYIQVALKSVNFWLGAYHAFMLILRNAARFTFVEYLAFMFSILGKILVISLTCLSCYFILELWDSLSDDLSSYFPVIFIMAIIAYVVCQIFFDVFSIAGNTILQCFILDCEISNKTGRGSAGHQPPALKKFIKQYQSEGNRDQIQDSKNKM
jgi:hypothetical protein